MPIAITMVDASCGCTTTEYTREVIRPGKIGMVKVTFNPAFRPGHFFKEVRVLLNNGRFYVRCWVEGNVVGYLHPVTEDFPYAFGRGLYMSLALLPFSSPPKRDGMLTFHTHFTVNTPTIVSFGCM